MGLSGRMCETSATSPVDESVFSRYSRSRSMSGSILWVIPSLRWSSSKPISCVAAPTQSVSPLTWKGAFQMRRWLRIWKAPFQVKGETLWVGAATHDIGFELDQRNDGITHKIDPDIDLEREYLEKTLSSTGLVAEVYHF